jgi:hypothetical protein
MPMLPQKNPEPRNRYKLRFNAFFFRLSALPSKILTYHVLGQLVHEPHSPFADCLYAASLPSTNDFHVGFAEEADLA